MPNPSKPSWHTDAPAADSGNGILGVLDGAVVHQASPPTPSVLDSPKRGERRTVEAHDPQHGQVRITFELKKNPRFALWFWTAIYAEAA